MGEGGGGGGGRARARAATDFGAEPSAASGKSNSSPPPSLLPTPTLNPAASHAAFGSGNYLGRRARSPPPAPGAASSDDDGDSDNGDSNVTDIDGISRQAARGSRNGPGEGDTSGPSSRLSSAASTGGGGGGCGSGSVSPSPLGSSGRSYGLHNGPSNGAGAMADTDKGLFRPVSTMQMVNPSSASRQPNEPAKLVPGPVVSSVNPLQRPLFAIER